ncbi:hypothetical protein P0N66_10235 [Desulfurivibrio alkaliphilus]|nr:hypothetical protein [Desulfurivibrio alkaliphilus]MDF1615330.1 hypothetical protein [Desulfurivibrio alkaliphilus]
MNRTMLSKIRSALGSVSFKLLQATGLPVFLSRINVEGKSDTGGVSVRPQAFEKILFATDFSNSTSALTSVAARASLTTLSVSLHLAQPGPQALISMLTLPSI